jgi:hypothetical protein
MKTYEQNGVKYGWNRGARKWQFTIGTYSFLTKCGGKAVADDVAKQIAGSIKRGGKIDGLARKKIAAVVA